MSFPAPRPVVSGEPYEIRDVQGHAPRQLGDFTGETTFVVDVDDEGYRVCGPGVQTDEYVRVYEKSVEGAGKDVRVWLVQPGDEGTSFTATAAGLPGRC